MFLARRQYRYLPRAYFVSRIIIISFLDAHNTFASFISTTDFMMAFFHMIFSFVMYFIFVNIYRAMSYTHFFRMLKAEIYHYVEAATTNRIPRAAAAHSACPRRE